ncbi:MAG: membrane lipoprotein lipid attachment site-containing protein, partial [Paludibacteraceae bacterium]|nr:membrane lipoprotein lipid attachment site-containing protein [Paludibacteraceae bacterium]
MKKVFFFLSIVLVLASCHENKINADFIAKSNPIMPVRMTADTMTILLTDYVPAFFGGQEELWASEMEVIDSHRIEAITLSDKKGHLDIPVLPNKPVRQA